MLAGISIVAPHDANIGDDYLFDLIQYDDQKRPTGGISFMIRVVSPVYVLKENQWQVSVFRELAKRLQNDEFDNMADTAEVLINQHLSQANGEKADPTAARKTFSMILRKIATSDLWGQNVTSLSEMATSLETRPSLATDLDALSLLLFYAQERLLLDLIK